MVHQGSASANAGKIAMIPRLRVGLTGGIGSGKSTVSSLFEELGTPVIDADAVAREVVQPGEPALAELVSSFGPDILDPDGRLDRRRLRERVFREPALRHRLESILHPRIKQIMEARVARLEHPYVLLSIPLLLEAQQTDMVDRILVVDAPHELQIRRTCARDQTSAERVTAIMDTQVDRETRLAAADDVIVNDAGLRDLRLAVERLHTRYLCLATGDLPAPDK